MAHALKAEFAAEFLKIEIVTLGQRLRHVHTEAGELHHGVAGDERLRKRRQCHRELDGGARFSTRRERKLLVDHGKDAAVGGIDHHCGAIHIAERIDGRLANHRILARRDVALTCSSLNKRAGREAFVIVVAAVIGSSAHVRARRGREMAG